MPLATMTVRDYADGQAIGEITLNPKQYANYVKSSQQPEGLIVMQDLLSLGGDYVPSEIVPAGRTVFLDWHWVLPGLRRWQAEFSR